MADKVKQKVIPVMAKSVKVKEAESDSGERRITFVASSNGVDRHYETVDVASLRLPLKGGGEIKVATIPEEGVEDLVDIPLMLNHSGDVRDIIGSVRKAFYKNGELIFEAGISSLETAQEMLTLIEEGHLSNAFSITMIDYDFNPDSETISNAEIIEVSLVYRGSNKEARLLAIKSLLGGTMPEAEKAKEVEAPETENAEATEPADEQPKDENAETEQTAESEAEESEKEAEGDEPEATETEAEKSDDESTNESKEEESMDNETAKAMVKEKAMPSQTTEATNNYLSTKAAVADFANILTKNATGQAADVKEAWTSHLASKGITNPEVLLPTPLVEAITDAVEKAGTIWQLIDKTGLTVYHTAMNTVGTDNENGRARGHGGDGADKSEEVVTLADRVIRGQYIYKYLTLPKEVIRENEDTGAIVNYVLTELPNRVIAEVERAIVIGDGREANSADKIESFVAITADAAENGGAGNGYAKTITAATGDSEYETLVKAVAEVEAEGDIYAIMSRSKKAALKLSKVDGHLVFGASGSVSDAIEVKDILTPSFMKGNDNIVLVVLKNYKGVGNRDTEAFTDFALKTNKHEYLEEIYAGGALAVPGSAVVVAPAGA